MPYPSEHAARLVSPAKFSKFRRQNDAGGSGIDFVYGIANGKSEIQAIRFDAAKFTSAEARSWLVKHDKKPISFTPATGKSSSASHVDSTSSVPVCSSAITIPVAMRDLSVQYGMGIDPKEIERGTQHELEHTSDLDVARKIALDHLQEDPQYYTKLEAANLSENNDNEDDDDLDHLIDNLCSSYAEHVEHDMEDYTLGYNEDDNTLTVEAFKTGIHTSAEGDVTEYSDEDLEKIEKKYNAHPGQAPVTIGHPKDSSPAYGWVDKVKKVGSKLYAKIKDINPNFLEALKNKAYKKISLSLYAGPEGYDIRHLAMLGGMAPAVKGLEPVSFSEESNKFKTYSFDEEITMNDVKKPVEEIEKENNFFRKLFNKFKLELKSFTEENTMEVKKEDKKEEKVLDHAMGDTNNAADASVKAKESPDTHKEIPATTVEMAAKETTDVAQKSTATKESVADQSTDNAKLSQENDDLKKKVEALVKELEGLKSLLQSKTEKSDADFCEELIKEGCLRPVDKDMTVLTLSTYREMDKVQNFSEEKSTLRKYRDHLKQAPKIVEFGEFPNVPNVTSGVNMPANPKDMNEMCQYIEHKIKDKLALPTKVSYWDAWKEAMAECSKEHPEIYAQYAKSMIPGGVPGSK